MYWDGSHWVDETPKPTPSLAPATRRWRDWSATGLMGFALVALIIPTIGAFAATSGASAPISSWSASYAVATYQEDSSRIRYSGNWVNVSYPDYYGGHVRSTDGPGATATLSFTGTAVVWVGPVGPTRGAAKLYLDGAYLKTVNTYASSFRARAVLLKQLFSGSAAHTLSIVVQGTSGHPTVAVDEFIVRGSPKVTAANVPAAVDVPNPPVASDPPAAATPQASLDPTPQPTATPVPATPDPTSAPTTAPPASTPAPGAITVSSVAGLLAKLADDSVTDIVVADGTYHVSPASLTHADSLWIGAAYAKRTHPVTVRAATRGGVTFDGGGTSSFGCLSFVEGAHDQTWDGFNCANGTADQTGVVTFGGYAGKAAPHHITMRNITIKASCLGSATSAAAPATDHAFYISEAVGGPHDLTFSDITVDGSGGLATAFHFYHSDSANQNGWNVTIERLHVTGTQQAIMLWDATLHDITIDTADISGALRYAIRYEGGTAIAIRNVTSTGSGSGGFDSSQGSAPAGITFSGDSLH